MKVRKFIEFINEEFNDTPEEYISTALSQIKRKIEKMFDFQEQPGEEPVEPKTKTIKKAKEDSEDKNKITFKDLGIRLESSEVSKYSKMYDSYTVKFSDDNATYALIFMIDIKDGIPKDPSADFSFKDIEKCTIKFKKYDLDRVDIIGQLSKTIDIKDINEEFLINLKIELDELFGDEDVEEFEIET